MHGRLWDRFDGWIDFGRSIGRSNRPTNCDVDVVDGLFCNVNNDYSGVPLIPSGGAVLRHSANHLAVEDRTLRRAMSYISEHLLDSITIENL